MVVVWCRERKKTKGVGGGGRLGDRGKYLLKAGKMLGRVGCIRKKRGGGKEGWRERANEAVEGWQRRFIPAPQQQVSCARPRAAAALPCGPPIPGRHSAV